MSATLETERGRIITAKDGIGPLIERNYWAELDGVTCPPEVIADRVRRHFEEFAPPETAIFQRDGRKGEPLEVGDELEIRISLLGKCAVRVVHADDHSLTLRTLAGHPEAGRITFGAYRDDRGDTVFRIRSRTRANGLVSFVGYHVMGRRLQGRCWINFVGKVAEQCGGRVRDFVHVRTCNVDEQAGDGDGCDPTFDCATPPCSEPGRR